MLGNKLVSMAHSDWLKVVLVLLIVLLPIIIIIVLDSTPTPYKFVLVEHKFVRDNNYYIVGKTTSPDKNGNTGEVDIYKVNKEQYDEFLEGFEYSVSTKMTNNWWRFNKQICDFKPMVYD